MNLAGQTAAGRWSARALEQFMYQIGHKHPIYYLHTSFGYYFEEFYLKPHGMVYELKSYPSNAPQPPLPTDDGDQGQARISGRSLKTAL